MPSELVSGVFDVTCRLEKSGKRYRVYLFTEGTPTLVDAGYEATTDAVIHGIEDVGVKPERLVVTHGDRDHIGGYDALVDAYDLDAWLPEQTTTETSIPPSGRYGDNDRIGQFVAVHVPGHAPDNHALVDEASGIAVMGDSVSGADRRGLPAGYFTLPPNSQDLDLAEESLERLLDYEFEVGLVFHGTSVTENAREKLDRYVNVL